MKAGLKASIADNGVLSVSRTGETLTPEQEVLAKGLEALTGADGVVTTTIVTSGYPKIDNFSKQKLDIGDISRAPQRYTGERSITGGELFAHAIGELSAIAQKRASTYQAAHEMAITFQNGYRGAAGLSSQWLRIRDPFAADPDGPVNFIVKKESNSWRQFWSKPLGLKIHNWDIVAGN